MRSKWKFHEPTHFFSFDPVGQGVIDFRINNKGGDMLSASMQGAKSFDWDVTDIDGFRFFIPEKYFNLNKLDLARRFEKYRRDPHIIEVEKQLFKVDASEISNAILLESKMLEFLHLWIDFLKNKDIGFYFDPISDYHQHCLENARNLLEENLSNTPSIKALSRKVGLNEYYLKRDFHKLYGLPIKQYIIKLRMEGARQLIRETDLPINEICERLGYTNRGHFAELYRRFFGIAPLADRIQKV